MMTQGQSSSFLMKQDDVLDTVADWHHRVLFSLSDKLSSNSEFPCLFSKNAFAKGLLLFLFVEGTSSPDIRKLAEGLADYVKLSSEWNGSLNTAYPLIIAFSLRAIESGSIEDYDTFGWEILQRLHEIDPRPWPAAVGKDANAASWSMCFNGMPLFCNMCHPAHQQRRSRNLGEHFLIVVNPRERFDIVAGDTPAGRKVRTNIRARIERFDGIPHCPQLAPYGSGALEWWQYSVADENVERTDKCPFAYMVSGIPRPSMIAEP